MKKNKKYENYVKNYQKEAGSTNLKIVYADGTKEPLTAKSLKDLIKLLDKKS